MKREELRAYDLVVLRDGSLGIYAERDGEGFLIYQTAGFDMIDLHYDEDLKEKHDGPDYDIMQVYRSEYGVVPFVNYEDEGDLVFERDTAWERPSEEERAENERVRREAMEQMESDLAAKTAERKKTLITVMAQAFYGNRVITEIRPDEIDSLVLGLVDAKFMKDEKIDRTVIPVPGTDHVVLVYNRYREEKEKERWEKLFRERGRAWKPFARIPELGIELYSRCIACRMDENGMPQSLQKEDYEVLMKYLAE